MARRVYKYVPYGELDEENVEWLNVRYITGFKVSFDADNLVWVCKITRVGGSPFETEWATEDEACAEVEKWKNRLEASFFDDPIVGDPDQ